MKYFLLTVFIMAVFSCTFREGLQEYIDKTPPKFINETLSNELTITWKWEDYKSALEYRYSFDNENWDTMEENYLTKTYTNAEVGYKTLYVQVQYDNNYVSDISSSKILVLNNICVSAASGDNANQGTSDSNLRTIDEAVTRYNGGGY